MDGLRDPRAGRDHSPIAADLRPRQPARLAGGVPAGQPQHQPGDHGSSLGDEDHRLRALPERDHHHHRRPGPARDHQQLPEARHHRPGAGSRGHHDDDPALVVHGALAVTGLRHRGDRLGVGLRIGRLFPRPAHPCHHRRAPRAPRRGHGLCDPDALADRGGGRPRPRRPPHPSRGTRPRARAARRHLRRRLRLHGAVVRQDARHPRVRLAAGDRDHRGVRVQHHRHPGGPRYPRVQVTHQGKGFQSGAPEPDRGVPGERSRTRRHPVGCDQRGDPALGHRRRGQARPADRPHLVGEPPFAGDQGHQAAQGGNGLGQRDRHADIHRPSLEQPDRRLRHQLLARAPEEVPRTRCSPEPVSSTPSISSSPSRA